MQRLLYIIKLLALFLWVGCQKDSSKPDDEPVEGRFTTEAFVEIADIQIGEAGGLIKWDNAVGSIGGITIEVPQEAYDQTVRHRVSYAAIKKSSFNDLIEPVSPIIRIDNNEKFSERPILITIKVEVPETDIIGAFYYEENTGELLGIPVVSRTEGEVKLQVWHFSTIVLSKVQRARIEAVQQFNLPFDLDKNYWNFGNILTHLGDGGMCTGMSLGAMYLYG